MPITFFKHSLCIALIFTSFYVHAQSFENPILDTLNKTVVYLRETQNQTVEINNKIYQVGIYDSENSIFIPSKIEKTGTAFWVMTDKFLPFLVTAAHVAKKMTDSSEIILPDTNNLVKSYKISEYLLNVNGSYWFYSKDADIAVSVLRDFTPIAECRRKVVSTNILDSNYFSPKRETELLIIGFPQKILNVDNKFSSVSKFVKASSDIVEIENEDDNTISKYILLDDPSIKGFSGAPVFVTPNFIDTGFTIRYDLNRVLGMVSGTFADNTGGKFATLVPSKSIVEAINGLIEHEFIEKVYHANGKLWQEKKYKGTNLCWEILSNFDKNGNPVEKGSLKEGNGTEYNYNEEGELKMIFEYKNGRLVNEIRSKK
jgi:hypothetical protein